MGEFFFCWGARAAALLTTPPPSPPNPPPKSPFVGRYQHKLPYTGMETASIWDINSWLRARQEARLKTAPWA